MGFVPHERVASVLMGKVERYRRIVGGGGGGGGGGGRFPPLWETLQTEFTINSKKYLVKE